MGQITVKHLMKRCFSDRVNAGSRRGLLCATVLCGLVFGLSGRVAAAAVGADAPVKVSLESKDNRNPVLSFKSNGSNGFVSWDGLVNGKRRILFREMKDSAWESPIIIDSDPAGNHQYPSIVADSADNVYVTWVGVVNGRKTPHLAMRINNVWTVTTIPFPDDTSVKGNCDYVNIKLDPQEKPWITWQWGFGNIYSVAVSRFMDNGVLTSTELTHKSRNHNLFPKVFFLSSPTVVWYQSTKSNFEIVAKSLTDSGTWNDAKLPDSENLPANSLPNLFMGQKGVNAVWYDNGLADQDQIQFAISGFNPIVHTLANSGTGNRYVSGSNYGSSVGFVWVSQDNRSVKLSEFYESESGAITTVSGVESEDPAAPQIDTNANGDAVVWMSDGSASAGNSQIYFRFINN